jgi:hypothetical protein
MSAPQAGGSPGYERSDLRAKTIAIALGLVAAFTVLGLLVSLWIFNRLVDPAARVAPPAFPTTAAAPEDGLQREPALQVDPIRDLARMRAEEDKLLTTYGWADREAGRARIPIERAMALLAERGLAPASGAGETVPGAARPGAANPAGRPPAARTAR